MVSKVTLKPVWTPLDVFLWPEPNTTSFSGSFPWPLCVCVRPLTLCGVKRTQSALPESPAVPPEPRSWGRCTPTPAAAPPSYKHNHHFGFIYFFTLTHYNKLSNRKLSLTKRKYCAEQIKSLADGLGSEQTEQQDISKLYLCWARENIVWKMVFLNSRIRLFYLLDRFQSIQKDNIPKSYVEEFNKKQKNRGKVCVYRSLNVGAHRIKLTHARFNIHVYCWNALLE